MNYIHKGEAATRRVQADATQAQAEWAARTLDGIVGTEREVSTLGRCLVLSLDPATRTARVLQRTAEWEQEYEVPFRAIAL